MTAPSMTDVAALEGTNGYTAVSTFSGCGGSSLGYRMAGFRVAYANEFVKAARDTYAANAPSTDLDDRDIRDVTADDLLERLGLDRGDLDVFDGSPPCSPFSTAGARERLWGETKTYSDTVQRSDDLFYEYARLVDGVQPRVFVAENVSGLVKGTAKGYFLRILGALEAAGPGYRVEARVLDSRWLGVPQARQRVIFVGVRKDLGVDPVFPAPLPERVRLRDAFAGLEPPATTAAGHILDPETGERIDLLDCAIGREFARLAAAGLDTTHARYLQLQRTVAVPDGIAATITASAGNRATAGVTYRPEPHALPRKFTLPELRRVSTFPDDFVLTGTYRQRWERIGRAVPPLMMRAVAETVRDRVLGRI